MRQVLHVQEHLCDWLLLVQQIVVKVILYYYEVRNVTNFWGLFNLLMWRIME